MQSKVGVKTESECRFHCFTDFSTITIWCSVDLAFRIMLPLVDKVCMPENLSMYKAR